MAQDNFDPSTARPINQGADGDFDPSTASLVKKPERTWGEAIKDTGTQLAEGVNTTLGAIPSVVAPQSKAAGFFRDNAQYWRDQQSDALKNRIAETDKRIEEAGKDGVLSQIGTTASEYWNDPAQAARFVATNLPSTAATLGTGAAAGLAAKGVAAARGLDAANKAALAAKYATTTAYATNAALNAGGARGEAFEDLQKTALAQGMTPEQAEQAGVSGSILPGVVGGVTGAISGKIGLEKAILGQATTGAAMRKAAGAFGAELAGEQIEELTPKVATNYQVGKIDPAIGLTDDLGRTMVETAIGSGPGAVVAGGAAGMRGGDAPTNTPPAQDEFTTSPGAADPNAPAISPATPPEAPDLTTAPGAGVSRDGVDFPREVDTSGLSLQDPAELERQRAATVDYQPVDTTPQWDTQPGAAQSRDGLNMPGPEFDTGSLGFDTRAPSERMGLDPAIGSLTTAAALSVDTGASPVQFLGATGRDMQLRQTGPGVANESNVIDVQGRGVDERAIPTPRRLTAQDGARESGAIAFRDGAPRSEIEAISNAAVRAEQLRGYDEAAQKASQPLALPAPSNLREGLDRIRAQREQAARTAQLPPTAGATSEPQANQAQQAVSQQPQAGGQAIAGPAAAPTAGQPAAPGGSGVQAAGLTNAAQTQNPGAQQSSPAAGAQAQAQGAAWDGLDPQQRTAVLSKAGWITNKGGLNVIGKRLLNTSWEQITGGTREIIARNIENEQGVAATAGVQEPPSRTPEATALRLGRDNTPLNEGGKPFKTRKAAGDAKKLQPMMRVVTVEGGYALAEKTPAQLAAEAKAARRLSQPKTGAAGAPLAAHEFIAAEGGLNAIAASDLGIEGNPRIGNRRLFAGRGRGLSMEQATQKLIADGYLSEGATLNDAYALIKTSLSRPQYTADGIERLAQAEANAQFDDYLAAQEEAADDGDPWDDAQPVALDDFSDDMLESSGYDTAPDAIKAEVRALLEMANALGIDTESIMLDAHEQTINATEQDYYAAAKSALEAAIARSNGDRRTPAGSEGQGQSGAATGPAAQELNQPETLATQAQEATESVAPESLELASQTPAEAAALQEAQEQAAKEEAAAKRAADAAAAKDEDRKRIAQASVRAAGEFELGLDPMDSLTGQGSVFDAPEPEHQAPKATEAVAAQPITRAEADAAQQQAAQAIADRIDSMTAGEVNQIAKRFLPTMGVKPTVSKERNKAAVTDFTKVNPLAAAAEFGVELPDDVKRALEADSEGRVADAVQDDGVTPRLVDAKHSLAAAKQEPGKPIEEAKKVISDFGEKIGGARKDRWKERGLNLDDLDSMSEAEGAELATKANVWKPDYEALSAAAEPVTAAMIKTIYDKLAAKPKKNTPEGRRQYVQMMRIVRDVYTEAKGPDAVRNAYLEIRKRAGLNTMEPQAKAVARELLFSVYKGRSDPFVLDGGDLMGAKKMVEDGFPAKGEPWKSRLTVSRREGGNGTTERGIEMYMELSAEVGTPLTREQIEAGFFRVVDKKNKAVAFAATKEDAEAAAKTVYERDMKGKKDGKPEPVRPNLDELKRENLPKRIDRDVAADDFVRDLGFRGIEFGLWSAQDERQRILNMAYDGLMDLAEIMGVPPKAMSLNGTLGMAFGARGGGRFAAHYEPGKLVINMTKIRGGGSMAHEWAHAMDHYFGELDKADAYTTQARGASGWYSEDQYLGVPRTRHERIGNEWKAVNKMRLDNLRPEMAAAFDEVMRALFSKQITKAEMVRSHELDLERTEALARNETQADLKAMYQNMAQNKRQALNELRGDPEGTMYAGRGRSDYASQAQALSGKSENGYWTRPTEMFARAFESWVFDRVTAMGAKSDYLVHGVEEDRFAGGAYKGNPYPAGEERARINAAFDKLAQTIKTKETDKGVAMFSRTPATKAAYEARIDTLFSDAAKASRDGVKVLDSSDVMGLLGQERVPLVLSETHVLHDGRTNHPEMTAEVWKRVPEWIENPAAVYTDPKHPGKLTIVAPERLAGYPVLIAVEPNTLRGKPDHLLVTAFAKTTGDLPAYGYLASSGRLRYADTKKAPEVWRLIGDSPRPSRPAPGAKPILSEKHLGGYRRANTPAAFMGQPTPPADSDARNVATQLLVDGLKAKWTRAPEIIVARNMQDTQIPQAVRDYDATLKSQGASGEARGFIYKGKVYLLSDQLMGPQQIAEVLFHEVLGHYGLRGVFGKGLDSILQQMGTMRRADVVAKAREYGLFDSDALGIDPEQASSRQIWEAMSAEQRLEAAEEVLAEMAQTQPNIGFVQRAIAAIRNWLRAHVPGFERMRLTDADIVQAYILPARGYVTRSNETAQQAIDRAMLAFSRDTNEPMTDNNGGNQGGRSADGATPGALLRKLEGTQVVDANGEPLLVYHGSKTKIDSFDESKTVDGGLHFGSKSQASMRSSRNLHPVYLYAEKLRRSKDTGGNWKGKIASAKAAGYDGITYLNRYEGLSKETVFRLHSQGLSEKLDRMSDAEFRRVVPEAEDSYIVFDAKQVIQPNESTAPDSGSAMVSRNVGDALADEAQRVQAAIEGKGLLDAARFLTRSSDKVRASIAQKVLEKLERLEQAGVKLELNIVHRGDMAPAAMANSRGYTETGFDNKGRDIGVWLNGADVTGKVGVEEEVLLHELVHAATTGMVYYGKSIQPNSLAGRHVRDLMAVTDAIAGHITQRFADADAGKATLTEFEQDMRAGANNAFRSDDEVLAWALSNSEAQQYLETIPYKSGSLWSNFVQSVRSLLGLSPASDTALSEVLRVADHLLTQDAPDAGRAAFWHKRGMRMVQQQGQGSLAQTQERAGDQTQTENFKRWFGDSKVVDAEGKPLVVYHGSRTGGFFSANPGKPLFFSSSTQVAQGYAGQDGVIQPAYLNISNPMDVHANGDSFNSIEFEGARYGVQGLSRIARARGYDGLIVRNIDDVVAEGVPHADMFVTFGRKGQVKSATGNNGAFDPTNPDIRFSRASSAAAAAGAAIKSVTATNIKKRAGFKLTDYLGLGLQTLGRRQIVDVYGDMLPLAEYNTLVTQMEADKNEGGAEADKLVKRWAELPDEGKLADLMHEATLAQIDPAKPYVGGDDKAKYAMLAGRFKALSQEAKQVYTDTRDAYQGHHAKVRSAIKERIERSELKGPRKAELLKQMDDEFFAAVKGVYFPLARFGQYAVTVKGANGKVESVSRAETKAEAEALRNSLLSAFPRDKGFTVGRVILSKDFIADRDAVGRGFMTELYQVLEKQDMDAAQRAELEDTLGQLYLSSLPDLSWAKHGIHRKGTPGFSQDARRAYAQNMFHGSRYLAKLRYSDLMQDELTAMQKHVDDWREVEDFDQNSAQRVVDEMNKRHESLMNPKSNPLSTALTSFGFVFHLGLSPASAMVNLSQTALVAYPIMGARWGFGKASAALLKASAEATKGKNDITGSLNADERAAYDEAVRAGTIDVTMAHDLAGIAQGEDAGVMWKIRPVMRWASFLFHHAERFNRQVTFVASYRLAREAGADQKAAFEQATKATYDGHFDYGAANRPRVMQGNVAKVLLLFKQYGQNMVYTLSRNAYQSIKGTDAEKAEARKVLAGLLTSHAMAAGVLGLPMVTTLLAAASMIGGDDDEPWDAKVALQNMLADAFGQKTAEVLAHGLSRLTPWDVSGRVGLDRLIFPDVQEGLEGQRLWESAATQALGPVGGIFGGALKGLDLMSDGHYKLGLEAMLPAVLRQAVKSVRYGMDGAQDKTGVSIKDEVSMPAVVGQFLGFSPSEVRLAQEGKSAVYQQDRALGERRQELLTKAARATMAKDAEARAEAMKEIERFNQKNPTRRITPLNVLQSVRNRNKRIDQAEGGIYLPKSRRDAMNAGRFAMSE